MTKDQINPRRDVDRKAWEIYLDEARKYDEGLVKSWKEDMDVTLVFSGLYSAVLTAFVIESYRNLNPDSGEASAQLLQQISQQLTLMSSGRNETVPIVEPFVLDRAAVICNLLWFLSLSLALTCAFLATFVQQWARLFLRRTSNLRPIPSDARLLSFFYFGLKKFKMHTVVDIIPSLLHISLFSFFGGLIAFLYRVNHVVMWIAVSTSLLTTSVYLVFTVLPVIFLDAPYRTPLSQVAWHVSETLRVQVYQAQELWSYLIQRPAPDAVRGGTSGKDTAFSQDDKREWHVAMRDAALQKTDSRDILSLQWTLRSLANDRDILPFMEAFANTVLKGDMPETDSWKVPAHILFPLLQPTEERDSLITIIKSMLIDIDLHRETYDVQYLQRFSRACPRALWVMAFLSIQAETPCHPDAERKQNRGNYSLFSISDAANLRFYIRNELQPRSFKDSILDYEYTISAMALVRMEPVIHAQRSRPRSLDTDMPAICYPESRPSPSDVSARVLGRYLMQSCECIPFAFAQTIDMIKQGREIIPDFPLSPKEFIDKVFESWLSKVLPAHDLGGHTDSPPNSQRDILFAYCLYHCEERHMVGFFTYIREVNEFRKHVISQWPTVYPTGFARFCRLAFQHPKREPRTLLILLQALSYNGFFYPQVAEDTPQWLVNLAEEFLEGHEEEPRSTDGNALRLVFMSLVLKGLQDKDEACITAFLNKSGLLSGPSRNLPTGIIVANARLCLLTRFIDNITSGCRYSWMDESFLLLVHFTTYDHVGKAIHASPGAWLALAEKVTSLVDNFRLDGLGVEGPHFTRLVKDALDFFYKHRTHVADPACFDLLVRAMLKLLATDMSYPAGKGRFVVRGTCDGEGYRIWWGMVKGAFEDRLTELRALSKT